MRWLYSIWSVLAVLVLALCLKVANPDWIQQIRLMGYDQKILSLPTQKSQDVVLLDIGENTLAVEGQFPFSRDRYARIINDIIQANGGVTSFTILFPEADRFGQDAVFASWAAEPSAVVLAAKSSNKGLAADARRPNIVTSGNGDARQFIDEYPGIVTNIPALESVVRGIGMVNPSPEVDGLTRRIPLVVQAQDKLYPSLPLESIRAINNTKGYTIKVDKELGIDSMYIHPREFKTNPDGSVWINWNITMDRYEWMFDTLPDLQGKTVIVGVTAEGVENPVPTPAGLMSPHQIQGSVLSTLLSQHFGQNAPMISRPLWADLFEWGSLILIGLVMIVAIYYAPLIVSGVTTVFAVTSVWLASAYAFDVSMYLLDWTFVTGIFIILALQAYGNNFIIQFKLRQQIKGQFGTYLSPDMVEMLCKDPSLLKLGGERREMSFMFMDICGFTPISEHYKNNDDPEGLVELINKFLDVQTKIILNNNGTVDKYMGDCIMAFWNAPLACDNHADMAVKTSIEILEATKNLNEELKPLNLPPINVGIGINTGDCIVGNMGSEVRFDYSVIGDAVNLGARLESQTRNYDGVDVLLSSFTRDACTEGKFREVDTITVKGKSEPVQIFTI